MGKGVGRSGRGNPVRGGLGAGSDSAASTADTSGGSRPGAARSSGEPGAGTAAARNPMGTDGFEFVEYTAPDPALLRSLFERLGFPVAARHRSKNVTLHKQGDINFIINAEPDSFAQGFARTHGPSACAMAFRVKDAAFAYRRALQLGAKPGPATAGPMELNIPSIEGIGGSLIYLVDRYGEQTIYDVDFKPVAPPEALQPAGLAYIDHLTHNVMRGHMDVWAGFYAKLFDFREIRYFDIEGRKSGLFSRALTSPCGKIRIPINESQDDRSQIEEYLREYHGEGIQHIALASVDIYRTVDVLRAQGVAFQDTPDTYYEAVAARVPGHDEKLAQLQRRRILIDGNPQQGEGVLLQIFTQNVIGPIFFEIIQRKGNEGFGEGNFRALFESIELDQIRRGVL
jgi:4-hydroxyphenylpyruvate dioxygenase